MKKPLKKDIKRYLNDIDNHFSTLIDIIIWYDTQNMDDWAFDIIHPMEALSKNIFINLLCCDFSKRTQKDKESNLYQSLWFTYMNVEQSKTPTHRALVEQMNTNVNKDIIVQWLYSLDVGGDLDGDINLKKVLTLYEKQKY